ncbi:unnamed protein product [Sphagnum tenellum]
MDHETVIGDIESRIGHGRKAAYSKGENMGLVPHEKAAKFCHNNQELGGVMLQHQRLDTSTCLLVICCLTTLLFGAVNVLHTCIEVVVDVIRSTRAPNWLNLLFNGPRSAKIFNSHDAKIAIGPAQDFVPLPACRELDEL